MDRRLCCRTARNRMARGDFNGDCCALLDPAPSRSRLLQIPIVAMPTYEYLREDGTSFEIQQRITEDPLAECPTTGQKVKRLISGGSGLVFKGSGFYVTDYVRKSGEPSSDSSKSEKTEETGSKKETSKETKTPTSESKPESKSESSSEKKSD